MKSEKPPVAVTTVTSSQVIVDFENGELIVDGIKLRSKHREGIFNKLMPYLSADLGVSVDLVRSFFLFLLTLHLTFKIYLSGIRTCVFTFI